MIHAVNIPFQTGMMYELTKLILHKTLTSKHVPVVDSPMHTVDLAFLLADLTMLAAVADVAHSSLAA